MDKLGEDRVKQTIHELYVVRGKSMEEIGKELAKDYRVVNKWIRKFGIERRPGQAPTHVSRLVLETPPQRSRLVVKDGQPVKITSIRLTDELAYLIGFVIGDGYVGPNNIELCNTEFGLIDPLATVLKKVSVENGGKVGLQYREFRTGRGMGCEGAYSYRFWYNNSDIARLIKVERKLRDDSIDLLLADKLGHFLAGFWDAEGSVWYSVAERLLVEVKATQNEINLEMIKKIIRRLDSLGIRTSCQLTHKKNDLGFFYGNPCMTRENVYSLHVFKESVPDWISLVGRNMLHPKKKRKISELEKLLEDERLRRSRLNVTIPVKEGHLRQCS